MKKYITPEWEIIGFLMEDIITTSGLINGGAAGEVGSGNGGDIGNFGDIF